jgi:hypothetical protein
MKLWTITLVFGEKFAENTYKSDFLSEKQPISKTKNHLKWSMRSEVIDILKSAIFMGFPRMVAQFFILL